MEVGSSLHVEIRGAQRLTFREKQVVALKEMGLSTEEIAARLSISPATVATLYARARNKGYEVVIVIEGEAILPPEAGGDQE